MVVKGGGVLQPQGWHLAHPAGFETLEELDYFCLKTNLCLVSLVELALPGLPL